MIRRLLYRILISCHPSKFRRAFGDEMLWIFDRSVAEQRSSGIFADALLSVLRQWLLRSGIWKVPVALLGGLIAPILGLELLQAMQVRMSGFSINSAPTSTRDFVLLAGISLALLSILTVTAVTLSLWLSWRRSFQKRRA